MRTTVEAIPALKETYEWLHPKSDPEDGGRGMRHCVEHDLPKPCAKCALLCPCGCADLRNGVTEEQWQSVVTLADAYAASLRGGRA